MRDPIDELENFEPAMPMNPLPASEVRRRGTRLRRRNTALATVGSVAVVALLATPIAVLAGHQESSAPDPAPAPRSWTTQIPDSFEVTAVPAGSPVVFEETDGSAIDDFHLCGSTSFSTEDGATDTVGATYGEPGTSSSAARTVAVFADDRTAAREIAQLRSSVERCPDVRVAKVDYVWDTVEASVPADESLVLSSQVQLDPTTLSDLTLFEVARIGNAVFVGSTHTTAGGPQAIEGTLPALTSLSQPVLDQMCVFSATGCTTASAAVEDPAADPVTTIPADFPLLDGLPTRAATPDFGRSGPTHPGAPLAPTLCSDTTLAEPGALDRLSAGWTDPAESRQRQLLVFADAGAASAYLDRFGNASTCPAYEVQDGVERVLSSRETDLGDRSVVAVTHDLVDGEPGPGHRVTQAVRVGNAVLLSEWVNDGESAPVTDETIAALQDQSDSSLLGVVEAMCVYGNPAC